MAKTKALKAAKVEKFNYCVGRPWGSSSHQPEALSIWMSFSAEVHYGTMEGAKAHRNYVDKETGEINFIYKLVKVDE